MSNNQFSHSNQFTNDLNINRQDSYIAQPYYTSLNTIGANNNLDSNNIVHTNILPSHQSNSIINSDNSNLNSNNRINNNKRHNSQSYIMSNNPSKRFYNNVSANYIQDPNQFPVPIQNQSSNQNINQHQIQYPNQILPNIQQFPNSKQPTNWVNQQFTQRNVQLPKADLPFNNSVTDNLETVPSPIRFINKKPLLPMQTPTPSSYNNNEVPSSPNLNISQSNVNKTYVDSDINNSTSDSPESNQSEIPLQPLSRPNDIVETNHIPNLSNQAIEDQSKNVPSASVIQASSAIASHQNQQYQQQQQRQQRQQQQQQQQITQRTGSEEEHQLAKKLKETYKNIVKLEEICHKGCLALNSKLQMIDTRHDFSKDLWTLYRSTVDLLDNYYDFLLCALRPSAVKTGKQIVDVYKIPRRMWVYGIVGFLEVLKTVINIYIEHEICACFIAHCFSIVSILTDSIFDMEGWWAEKLGDLSRMAIALYSSRNIDWKVSSEFWYQLSMKTQYGHGKIYYHMSTVQQDNLEALVNIGKSVTCRDPFVPTPQYLKLVVENICNQRHNLSQAELPIIDFIKVHKMALASDYNQNKTVITTLSRYSRNFGTLFGKPSNMRASQQDEYSQLAKKMIIMFEKGSSFALSNIIHLIGFGDHKNPLARLFELPEALKDRKDKKEKKHKSRSSDLNDDASQNSLDTNGNLDSENMDKKPIEIAAYEMLESHWFESLDILNKGIIELSVRILKEYLSGPQVTSTSHIIVWLYFLVSIGEASTKYPTSASFIEYFLGKFVPWNTLINYLNNLLLMLSSNSKMFDLYNFYNSSPEIIGSHGNFLNYFSSNETLPEVWKCWGTLWFDYISLKGDYSDIDSAGLKKDFFDTPAMGQKIDTKDEHERYVRILLLAKYISDNYNFGLIRDEVNFKFSAQAIKDIQSIEEIYSSLLSGFLNDSRFEDLFEQITTQNLGEPNYDLTIYDKDGLWYHNIHSNFEQNDFTIVDDKEGSNVDDSEEFDNQADVDSEEFDDSEPYLQSIDKPNLLAIPGDFGMCMDSSVTYFTLDTNTWLKHCGRIFKCIRGGVFKSAIPLTVFQELRSLRKSHDMTVSDGATRAVITIRELNSTNQLTPLRFDGTESSSLNETTEFENNSNWRSSVDEAVLKTVSQNDEISRKLLKGNLVKLKLNSKILDKNEAANFRYCVLVTDDRNMRLRARTFGLMSYKSKWLFNQIERIAKGRCTN